MLLIEVMEGAKEVRVCIHLPHGSEVTSTKGEDHFRQDYSDMQDQRTNMQRGKRMVFGYNMVVVVVVIGKKGMGGQNSSISSMIMSK